MSWKLGRKRIEVEHDGVKLLKKTKRLCFHTNIVSSKTIKNHLGFQVQLFYSKSIRISSHFCTLNNSRIVKELIVLNSIIVMVDFLPLLSNLQEIHVINNFFPENSPIINLENIVVNLSF